LLTEKIPAVDLLPESVRLSVGASLYGQHFVYNSDWFWALSRIHSSSVVR
jgi:hypothetical protein